jgi:hypothetical protein
MIPSKILTHFKLTVNYVCSKCSISSWLEDKLTLEIDHVDGNNTNHNLLNLRYLCPNCHSQTDTWRGRNKNSGTVKVSDEELLIAISETQNIRQALIKVGLSPRGPNYNRVSNLLNTNKIDFKNSQYNTIWINDGTLNKKIKKEELNDYLVVGYTIGRIGVNQPSIKGRVWVTNGIINKMCNPDSIPDGFWKGKFHKM